MKKLIDEIDKYVKKAPPLPANIKELLVQFAPWLAILTVLTSLPAILSILRMGTYVGAYGGYYAGWGMRYTLMVIFLIANVALRAFSIKGLFAKSINGWNYLFYSILLYLVYAVFTFDIIGGLVSTLVSLYLIFQIRTSYK
jgi:hypothetical protein